MSANRFTGRVTVGVDGSPNSLAALRCAAKEANRRDATLDVVYVMDARARDGRPRGRTVADAHARLQHSIETVLGSDVTVPVRLRVVAGEPGVVLPQLAHGAALLLLGARDDADDMHPLGGTTVPVVLAASPCEVVVCADHEVSANFR